MKIIKSWPPNIEEIRQAGLEVNEESVFCYGNDIYCLNGKEPRADILFHENIHIKQQKGNPEVWWTAYLQDRDFRFREELEAYTGQYLFIKRNLKNKAVKEYLDIISEALASPQYKLGLTKSQTETAIRKNAL